MFLKQALEALQEAAQHPLALGMYVVLVISWLVISLRVKRHRILMRHLKKLPEKDRLKALELEMGPSPKKGINAEQWLRARGQTFKLARVGIVCVTSIIVLTIAAFYYLNAAPNAISVAGRVSVDNEPLPQAMIRIVGLEGQWQTDQHGAFQFQMPDILNSDSVTFSISHTTDFETIRLDTTVAKAVLRALHFNLATSKTCIIAGRTVEKGTGTPIGGAQVILEANRGKGITDEHGYFRFEARGKPSERVEATISHEHYESISVGLTLSPENRILLRRKP